MSDKLKELDKLNTWLENHSTQYGWTIERIDEDAHFNHRLNRHQVNVTKNEKYLWDAICHYGSYGYEDGLLEIYGDIVNQKKAGDSVEGWLTAEDVIKRIKERYGEKESEAK